MKKMMLSSGEHSERPPAALGVDGGSGFLCPFLTDKLRSQTGSWWSCGFLGPPHSWVVGVDVALSSCPFLMCFCFSACLEHQAGDLPGMRASCLSPFGPP